MTCPLCGCLTTDDAVDCDICHHTGCPGCIGTEDGICMTCRDIEKERHA